MRLHDLGVVSVGAIVFVAVVVGWMSVKMAGKEDAPIEEFCEQIVEMQTGVEVDLTPSSPEQN